MNWDTVGAVSELVGAIAVVISLLYLARQIRNSAQIERLNARYAVSQSLFSAFSRIDEDPELHRVWVAAGRGEELDEEDRERLGRFLYKYFAQLQLAYGYSEIDPEIRARYKPNLVRFLKAAVVRSWWSRQREFFHESFRSEVDLLLTTLDPQ
jgi:hypothetical protein